MIAVKTHPCSQPHKNNCSRSADRGRSSCGNTASSNTRQNPWNSCGRYSLGRSCSCTSRQSWRMWRRSGRSPGRTRQRLGRSSSPSSPRRRRTRSRGSDLCRFRRFCKDRLLTYSRLYFSRSFCLNLGTQVVVNTLNVVDLPTAYGSHDRCTSRWTTLTYRSHTMRTTHTLAELPTTE